MASSQNIQGASDRPRRRPVMADVAALAGVSHQTVSRVINGSDHVRPETRQRVLAAMDQLDYRPNPAARALVTGRSSTLGVVSFDTTLYGPASTLFAIEQAAHAAGYFITIVSLLALDRDSVLGAIERLRVQGVDGILVITPHEGAANALVNLPTTVPIVAVEASGTDSVPLVAVDQLSGAVSATQLLLDLGHRTVWHVAGPQDFVEAQQRREGWRATLEAAGAEVPPVLVGDWSPRSGYQLGQRLAQDPGVTAVFVANDQMALGVLRAMHEYGRHIPREVSVVGFDDVPEAQYFTPPLTTVRQNFAEVGRGSLRLLLDVMRGGQSAQHLTVAPELVVRRSTAPPPDGR
ncbi:MAG TPA: LacI family DNA-binding transcriptional regulator [Solirubrobacteraceae bacterium]|jgi:DNA-binding LacI/PurR family transcriptional regulator|nr:LacI family DNA-binding transcriptional regulator [Solirubrobacteraceae bacterium]